MRASSPTEVCNIAGFAFSRLVTGLAPVRRGGIYPARGCSRRREAPGTMQASSPTKVCYNMDSRFPGQLRAPARFVGEGHGPPAGPYTATFSRLVSMFSPFRRAGVHARRTLANSKMEGLRHCWGRVFPVGHEPCPVRRGGIYPARGCLCSRNVPGTMQASSPTKVCYNAGARFPGWPLCFPLLRRAGVYVRRRALVFRRGSR